MEPGQHLKTWAAANDPAPPPNKSFGAKNVKLDGVDNIFQATPTSKLADYVRDKQEAMFARNKREPLGAVPVLNAKPPKFTEAPEFKFGHKNRT